MDFGWYFISQSPSASFSLEWTLVLISSQNCDLSCCWPEEMMYSFMDEAALMLNSSSVSNIYTASLKWICSCCLRQHLLLLYGGCLCKVSPRGRSSNAEELLSSHCRFYVGYNMDFIPLLCNACRDQGCLCERFSCWAVLSDSSLESVFAAPWSYIHSDSLPNNIPWGALIFNCLDNVRVF